jgi:hypothetical protein
MESIAQQVYGDASLWYVVADANGFDEASDIPAAGQTLKLPEVTTNSNTAETFKPYNPRQISGSTTPALPQAPMPAPSAHHCSTLAQIVVIAVVIVASIYTAGAAAEAFGATSGATFSTGASVLAGSSVAGVSTAEGIAAAAIGGAVGDAAGQLAGDALGVHQGFSWGEVAGAGLGAGITAGLAGEISGGQTIAQLHDAGGIANDARIAGIGAAGAIGSYSGEKLVGQPAHFSWASIAAAAVGTEATTALSLNSTLTQKWGQAAGGSFVGNVVGGLVNGAIDSETARLLGGDAANGNQIAVDAFGNAVANAAVAGIETTNAQNEARQQVQSAPSLLSADNPNSQVNPVAAFLSGPYADTGAYAGALAGYKPFNGPLLASSDEYSMLTGVYGLRAYPALTAGHAADVRSLQGEAPWLDSGEWSSDVFQSYIDATGDVNVIGNPVYDASGMPVLKNGQQVVIVPAGASVTPSAEELAQLRAESSGGLPPIENSYTPRVGYFENAYNYYMAGVADSRSSVGQRAWNLVEALATVPLALPDMAISGVYNAGNEAALAGQEIARGTLLTGSNGTLAYLHGGQHLLNGFLGLGSAATLGESAWSNRIETAESGTDVAGGTVLRTPQEFLTSRGITDPALQRRILNAGLDTNLLDPDTTPASLARFDKLFVDTINGGKSFSGRLGNIDTRVATINQAAELELNGFNPRFEFPVYVGSGQTRFVDLVGIDSTGQQATQYIQFVKMNAAGNVIRADEIIAAEQIERALNLPPGTVQLVNTTR